MPACSSCKQGDQAGVAGPQDSSGRAPAGIPRSAMGMLDRLHMDALSEVFTTRCALRRNEQSRSSKHVARRHV